MFINPQGLSAINLVLFLLLLLGFTGYKYIFKKNINLLVLLICISILPIWSIFRNGTYESSDLTLHTHYLMSFFENLQNGIIVPQWTNVGYGTPVFIFLYPLPFYIGSLFHVIGFSFLNSMKLVLASSFILSGIGMYYFLKNEFEDKAGFIGAIFYLFTPFHFVDMHFRASVGETLSFAFIPFIFLFSSKLLKTNKYRYFFLNSLFIAFEITSHLATSLIALHLLFIFFILKLHFQNKKIKVLFSWLLSVFLGIGLSAFYWYPATTEVKNTLYYLTLPTQGFLQLNNLLYSTGRMFIVFQGNRGDSQYLIGYLHIFVFFILIFLIFNKLRNYERSLALFLTSALLFLSFMTLTYSKPLWQLIFYLNNFQFAWRLLLPISFISSFIAGFVAFKLKKNKIMLLVVFLTILITIPNWGNRKMASFPTENRSGYETLYTEYYDPSDPIYHKIYDDLGKVKVREIPNEYIKALDGNTNIKPITHSPNYHFYIANTKTTSLIKENTLYFPGWKLYINNKQQEFNYKSEKYRGIILFNLKPGIYKIELKLEDTLIRSLGKLISFSSLILLLIAILIKKQFK